MIYQSQALNPEIALNSESCHEQRENIFKILPFCADWSNGSLLWRCTVMQVNSQTLMENNPKND